MKPLATVAVLLAGLGLFAVLAAGQEEDPAQPTMLRVGIFDSRCVCMAYVGSKFHEEHYRSLLRERDKAREQGDEKRVEELEASGQKLQEKFHAMGFGTAPVDGLLRHIQDELPGIAEEAGVDLVVSKWSVVYERPGIELVDVTDRIVAPFDPDEETQKSLREIRKHEPVPMEELEKKDHDHD